MKKIPIYIAALMMLSVVAHGDNGLVNVKSAHDVATTANRLEKVLAAKGMKVFMRINHAQGAASVGTKLRPTELVVFGNPKVGSPLMACNQTTGIDLPQKALIWEDAQSQVWLSYNNPKYLDKRHNLGECAKVIAKVTNALANFAKAATQP